MQKGVPQPCLGLPFAGPILPRSLGVTKPMSSSLKWKGDTPHLLQVPGPGRMEGKWQRRETGGLATCLLPLPVLPQWPELGWPENEVWPINSLAPSYPLDEF